MGGIPGIHRHRPQLQRLPGGGARPVQPKQRRGQFLHAEKGGDELPQQVSGKYIADIRRLQPRLFQRDPSRLLLHGALGLFPGILPKQGILIHQVYEMAQRPVALLFPGHGRAALDTGRMRKRNALFSSALFHQNPSKSIFHIVLTLFFFSKCM